MPKDDSTPIIANVRKPVSTRTRDYGSEIRKAWGDEWHKKETAYEFSNGRKFVSPGDQGGPYGDL